MTETPELNAGDLAELESKRIANRLARDQATAARTDKLIEQLSKAVPDLASVAKSTVSFREGATLRQGEATAVALASAAQQVAGEVAARLLATRSEGEPCDVFVTSDPNVVASLVAYHQIRAEAAILRDRLRTAKEAAEEALEAPTSADGAPRLAVEAGIAAAAVVGRAATQVASLFELDVEVATSTVDIPATTVQAAVMGRLLEVRPELGIQHQWARLIDADASELLRIVGDLTAEDIDATVVDARLDAAVESLADATDLQHRSRLQSARTDLAAVLAKARAFAVRVSATPSSGGASLLAQAVAVEHLASGERRVLVVGGARSEAHQVVVKRRLRTPRLQTGVSVGFDYLLVQGQGVIAAGHATAAVAYVARLDGSRAEWRQLTSFALSRDEPPGSSPGAPRSVPSAAPGEPATLPR
ncbi:hypothetical protein [Nocardioides albidus]|uniref:hypothetical protein n=1 Tax=Nocardioides albidus TaxID=1517589 RepID=UPI0013052E12|nr:hypothetical protein [Nocardioides albidus]